MLGPGDQEMLGRQGGSIPRRPLLSLGVSLDLNPALRMAHYPGFRCGRVLDPNGLHREQNHDQCARARKIFILRCGTKDLVLFVPQSRHRINSGRSPRGRIPGENRGAQEDDTG